MNVLAAVVVLVAVFLTIGVAANVEALDTSDAAGNGMAAAFAWFFAIADWLVLAVLLLVCAALEGFPHRSGIAMLLAFVLAIAGQVTALQVLTDSKVAGAEGVMLRMVTWIAPALVILRAVWGLVPAARVAVAGIAGAWTPIVLLILVSLIPFPFRPRYAAERAAAEARAAAMRQEYQEANQVQDRQRVRETLAKIAALPPDSALFAAIPFCADPDPAIREAARAKARTFVRRQADAEQYLAQGHDATLRELPDFDLAATPAVCVSARKALAAKAAIQPFDNDPIRIEDAEREVAPYIDTMRWLLAHGCDCKPEISALEASVRRFAPSPRREKILADLGAAGH